MTIKFIAIDWGSTNFRAYRVEEGQNTDVITLPIGITQLKHPNFDQLLSDALSPWHTWIEIFQVPIILAGMIGSDRGWVDSGYQMLPQPISAIKRGCIQIKSSLSTPIYVHSGLAINTLNFTNVMRGEEVQLLGAISLTNDDCYVFPGTHSKWIEPIDGQITSFNTIMTGELYYILMQHSLLGQSVPKAVLPEGFALGLKEGTLAGSDIISKLFIARSARVLHQMPAEMVAGWLSGLLIGHEVATQLTHFKNASSFSIIAAPALAKLYQQAFQLNHIETTAIDPEQGILYGFRSIYDELYS
ncbi:2-dehydro-3-deoxygalactonokinase [Providencia burhodogranariea]|uniref:2-oxo-3-deoxygalactonate kinase n=1 Tax=Providencia burhodogranariea DSM 19968 TaxID=1141662 RepID=K8W603_9GAMM|nr:2-dehydro-3-deoxygalactonokinase [Providencia burhodogranariea]EKT56038.1 2-oxo-3-deoxygalactonate kinase [Providencia burhodogranariea DSM 19968]